MTSSNNQPTNLNQNSNALINVPKKYQFRGKRLNIDSQTSTSSKTSQIVSIQKPLSHTKSGPLQPNSALQTSNLSKNSKNKIKLVNYQPNLLKSPDELNPKNHAKLHSKKVCNSIQK
jgi:hypothetical protein